MENEKNGFIIHPSPPPRSGFVAIVSDSPLWQNHDTNHQTHKGENHVTDNQQVQQHIQSIKLAVTDALQNNYFQLNGRAARPAFWWFALAAFAVNIVGMVLPGILSLVITLALLPPSVGLLVRRFHDIDKPGIWALMAIVPVLGWIAAVYFTIQPGTPGANTYGAPPTNPLVSTQTA